MKYFIAIVLALISFNAQIFSQTTTPSIQWQKALGGSGDDEALSIQQTTDGGYIIAGGSASQDGNVTGNHGSFDYWIVKLDANGNMTWQKTFGGTDREWARSIQQTADGGYIVGGITYSPNDGDVIGNHGGWDYWIVKLDAMGNTLWKKTLGGSWDDYANSIQQTKDGGYIIAGMAGSIDGDVIGTRAGYNYWIVKLDINGNISWKKTLGTSGEDGPFEIRQTIEGGYVIAGYVARYAGSSDGDATGMHGGYDCWIVKLDANGNMTWQKALGGSYNDVANGIQQCSDGGYIIAAQTESNDGDVTGNHSALKDCWIVKLDVNGNKLWQKTLGGTGNDIAQRIQQTSDGGYIMTGFTSSNDGDVAGNHGADDYWIVKLDANGNKLWQKALGGVASDYAYDIQQTKDGSYVVAGKTYSTNGDVTGNHGGLDYWIAKLTDPCTPVTPTINIVVSPNTSVCAGSQVTFTATAINGGTSPIYQWKKNGVNVGINSNTYIVDTTLKNSDSIYCVLTSNAACATTATAQSNGIKMTVTSPVAPTVSIAASPGTAVCTGSTVTFTATATNGGTSPIYQWKKNGMDVGTNSKTYADAAIKNGDSIYCVLASNASCITKNIVNSNGIKMTVSNPITPTVSITVSPSTTVCAGTKVIFTAIATNGGVSPVYQWKKNGINVGANSNTYVVDTALKNNDSIYCVLNSNAGCVTTSTANSNKIKMTVNNAVTPIVSIAASPGTSVCIGAKVTFTATATNGGTSPVYQWKKNGINVGSNSKTYVVDTALKNGDSIYCVLTSNASCVTTATAKSNVVKMTVNQPTTPTVSIAATPGTSICTGSSVTFTATITNGGTSPIYQWTKNGVGVASNSKTYIDPEPKNGDSIYCILASNA